MISALSNSQRASSGTHYGDDDSSDGPMIKGINKFNDALNGPFLSSFGQALNHVPIVGPIAHVIPDMGGHILSKMGEGFAHMLGEKGAVHTHFEHEWLGLDNGKPTGDGNGLSLKGRHPWPPSKTLDASNDGAMHATTSSVQRTSARSVSTPAGYGIDRFDDSVPDRRIATQLALASRPIDLHRFADVSDGVSERRFSVDIRD
ncbi:hypothetical protein [Paraburkholderia humisilvae]|uniref:Uncharacterized protein n=1 Tax=Paraburkholderia humisilvae TaxID=627669 RepID=A0A6J5DDH9_9BURK|nr:hypothetical protein [Paraburkholderia humisilvae]CAB3750866.1 hypothetical protein LMG29542_01355 [Paraburkholderia humisilvae]